MRRLALAAFFCVCALVTWIAISVGGTAVGADDGDRPLRRLSEVRPVERFGQEALDAQSDFLQQMTGVTVRYGDNGAVSEIKGHTGVLLQSGLAGFTVGQPAGELLEKFGPALLSAGTEELRVRRIAPQAAKADPVERANSPERTIRLVQYIRGREVQQSAVNISLNIQTNEVMHLVADFLPDRGIEHEPRLTAAEARAKVEAAMRASVLEDEQRITFENAPAHLAYAFEEIGETGGIGGVLVWVFQVKRGGESLEANVSALTGEVIRLRNLLFAFSPNRISYTANNTAPPSGSLPNGLTPTFNEGGSPPDQVASDLYGKAGIAFGVFDQALGRNSWDGAGSPLRLVTHYAMTSSPAAYMPGGYIIIAHNSPATANDIDAVSHEFAHGIVQQEIGLIANSGAVDGAPALNEAYGDWGATVADVHLNLGFVSPATWSISTLRNLQAPTTGNTGTVVLTTGGEQIQRIWLREGNQSRANTSALGLQTPHRNSTIMGHAPGAKFQ